MKLLIVDTYYPAFLERFEDQSDTSCLGYEQHRDLLLDQCFGTSDFYSRHLRNLGIDVEDIVANHAPLQRKWVRDHGVSGASASTLAHILRRLPLVGGRLARAAGLLPILRQQILGMKPDVLYMQDLSFVPPAMLAQLRREVPLIVGQIACPLPAKEYLEPYDLILTSFPHFVPRFRAMGIASEYFRIGFEPAVLQRVGGEERGLPCSFVGGLSPAHVRGTAMLEELARQTPIEFFGYGAELLPPGSPIRERHHGEVWGIDMYRKLAQSQITVNRHIDVAENNANNMRLFEATGCGAMLLTDAKDNLGELFDVGTEVVTYRSAGEAVEMIKHYLAHPEEREKIARAGQARTLAQHSYQSRMSELAQILERYRSARRDA